MLRRTFVLLIGLAMAAIPVVPLAGAASATDHSGAWPTDFHAWTSATDFADGRFAHTVPSRAGDGAITLAPRSKQGTWTSDWYASPETFTQAVPSWQAQTPGKSWVAVELQVRTPDGTSRWYRMANWAFEDSKIKRRTERNQSDAIGTIYTDTFVAASGVQAQEYRLRVVLHGTKTDRPVVGQVGSTVARPDELPDTSTPTSSEPVELDVPSYSQSIHSGEYPKYGGGGGVWCSPTSTAMVLSYWGTGPTAADIASLPKDKVFDANGRKDGEVDWAAIHTWDYTYDGAGNWAFNTAYASAYGLDGSVRQYSSLRAVGRWVRDGVPVVVSIDWDNTDDNPMNDLTGSSISGTDGHLMVVVGFTASGDVIANDPASPTNAEVRHVYQRDQFERNWLRASDGTTYVIAPSS